MPFFERALADQRGGSASLRLAIDMLTTGHSGHIKVSADQSPRWRAPCPPLPHLKRARVTTLFDSLCGAPLACVGTPVCLRVDGTSIGERGRQAPSSHSSFRRSFLYFRSLFKALA